MRDSPEPRLDPPDNVAYITADCGHEVYEGETYVYWKENGKTKTLCPDCFLVRVSELSIQEVEARMGCEYSTVEKKSEQTSFGSAVDDFFSDR